MPPLKTVQPICLMLIPAAQKRKNAFRAALALTGRTQAEWARETGVTPPYLSDVVNGKVESRRLTDKIDAFITESGIPMQSAA
jgi:hypothetical protein